jgi:hypothetical protein
LSFRLSNIRQWINLFLVWWFAFSQALSALHIRNRGWHRQPVAMVTGVGHIFNTGQTRPDRDRGYNRGRCRGRYRYRNRNRRKKDRSRSRFRSRHRWEPGADGSPTTGSRRGWHWQRVASVAQQQEASVVLEAAQRHACGSHPWCWTNFQYRTNASRSR